MDSKNDKDLIELYSRRIERCKALAPAASGTPAEVDPSLPIDEWMRRRNEATLIETCFGHLQEEFEIMKPHYLEVGYSEATLDFIEGEIKRAMEGLKQ